MHYKVLFYYSAVKLPSLSKKIFIKAKGISMFVDIPFAFMTF